MPERFELLERYHDGEVSEQEAAEAEALLAQDGAALSYLGELDDLGELLREADALELSQVSFEGMWDNIHSTIQEDAAQAAAREAAAREANRPGFGERLSQWLQAIFVENKSAWITAGATACAVAVVLFVMDDSNDSPSIDTSPGSGGVAATDNAGTRVERVVEKHYIYVDSVEQADPDSMVVVNSLQEESGDNTAVIWLLPDGPKATDKEQGDNNEDQGDNNEDDGVEIEEQPL
ncbi:MAG: hypothetical protein CMH57_12610 [Myxococcales bacterium]|nr:hypothetical protein [Myxococcales bacterium]